MRQNCLHLLSRDNLFFKAKRTAKTKSMALLLLCYERILQVYLVFFQRLSQGDFSQIRSGNTYYIDEFVNE